MTIADALAKIRDRSSITAITGQALLAHVTGRPREWLLSHTEESLTWEQATAFEFMLASAAQGQPLAYLTGEKEFCSLAFRVTPAVLIPRPETEMLVEAAVAWAEQGFHSMPRIADVGTGSGVIAISVAARLPGAVVTAIDMSDPALAVAQGNALRHGVADRVRFVKGDLLGYVDESFDVILANLPYIPTNDLIGLEVSHWEPAVALDGGEDGLDLIRQLVDQAEMRLSTGGMLALEIQFDQGERVAKICREAFPRGEVSVLKDLAGLDRVVTVARP